MSVGAVILFVLMLAIIGVLVFALGARDEEIMRLRGRHRCLDAYRVSPSARGPVGTPGKGNPFFDPGRPPSAGSSMTPPPPIRLEVTP